MIDPMGKRIGTLIVLIIFTIYAMIPIILVVFNTFKNSQENFENDKAPPTQMMCEKYNRVWEQAGFKNYFMNSVVIALPTVLCVVIFST